MDKTISLKFVWTLRLSLMAEGDTLRDSGNKLKTESDKLWAEGDALRTESAKLIADAAKLWTASDRLMAKGNALWAKGVLEAYGDVTIEWHSPTSCTVNGTDRFK